MESALIIGISGASGSGKSYISKKIVDAFPDYCCAFGLDNYYKAPDFVTNLKYQHDNPDSIDYQKALEDLESLIQQNELKFPVYDYKTHKIIGWEIKKATPIIIVEGLFIFYDPIFRQRMQIKIWIDAEESLRYKRRVNRDVMERGEKLTDVQIRYVNNVKPAYEEYIMQCRNYANIIYKNNGFNAIDDLLGLKKILASSIKQYG